MILRSSSPKLSTLKITTQLNLATTNQATATSQASQFCPQANRLLRCQNDPSLLAEQLENIIPDTSKQPRRIQYQVFDDFCDLLDATPKRLELLDLILANDHVAARLLTKKSRVTTLAELHPERAAQLEACFKKIKDKKLNKTLTQNETPIKTQIIEPSAYKLTTK